jgi:predicted RNase H-like nuclease (RuvC/YqgF family)
MDRLTWNMADEDDKDHWHVDETEIQRDEVETGFYAYEGNAVDLLAAYEDTGMTPEECLASREEVKRLEAESARLCDEQIAITAEHDKEVATLTAEIAALKAELKSSDLNRQHLAAALDKAIGQAHDQAQSDSLTIGTLKEELREAREVARLMVEYRHLPDVVGGPLIYPTFEAFDRLRKLAGGAPTPP